MDIAGWVDSKGKTCALEALVIPPMGVRSAEELKDIGFFFKKRDCNKRPMGMIQSPLNGCPEALRCRQGIAAHTAFRA